MLIAPQKSAIATICAIITLMKKSAKFFVFGTVFLAIAVVFTVLIKTVDVSTPNRPCYGDNCDVSTACVADGDLSIGFASFNTALADKIGVNLKLYKLTELAGYVPIVIAGIYGIVGFTQLVKRKSFAKVDPELYALAGLFIVICGAYILFEKLALNYRPVCIGGELEASFPSSHTILALSACLGMVIFNLIFHSEEKFISIFVNIVLSFLAAFILAGRFFSGVHWGTDIIGGIFYSIAYLFIYSGALVAIANSRQSDI